MGNKRPSNERLAILLDAQLRLDEAHIQYVVAQSNGGVPSDIPPKDVTTWKLHQRAEAAAELHKAQLEMTRYLTEFQVPVNVWRRRFRKEAAQNAERTKRRV